MKRSRAVIRVYSFSGQIIELYFFVADSNKDSETKVRKIQKEKDLAEGKEESN